MEKVKKYVNVKAQGQIPTRSNEPTKGTTQQDYAIVTNRRASPGPPKRKDVKDNIKQRRANDKKIVKPKYSTQGGKRIVRECPQQNGGLKNCWMKIQERICRYSNSLRFGYFGSDCTHRP